MVTSPRPMGVGVHQSSWQKSTPNFPHVHQDKRLHWPPKQWNAHLMRDRDAMVPY
ncbi:hypothetical protein SKAU_G00047090 [Synaphobranchus kaupii]|uniref:Uncharacterized protein n=1 Tax=Synaphobranchus kaupii TaxID=118154 RepID=A0A9Q1J779_SYNKA|nr:hypothetical protein SKAU_G00047090 [Synaphobranchus kaupii]